MQTGIQHLSNAVKVALCCVAFFSLWLTVSVQAKNITSEPATQVTSKYLWLTNTQKADIKRLFDPTYLPIRFKYSDLNGGRDWLMKEYGKEQLIDYKVRVKDKAIESIQVLQYRESYGGEIKQSRFRAQFIGARLQAVKQSFTLTKPVDGISGATISVDSTKRVAAMALFLENELAKQLKSMPEKPHAKP